MFDWPNGVAHCIFCPSRNLKVTRIRLPDIKSILIFQFPVRCGRCGQRQYTAPLIAALAFFQKVHLPRRSSSSRPNSSWAAWTDTDPNETHRIRPITTVMEPKASRLTSSPQKPVRRPAKHDDSIW